MEKLIHLINWYIFKELNIENFFWENYSRVYDIFYFLETNKFISRLIKQRLEKLILDWYFI